MLVRPSLLPSSLSRLTLRPALAAALVAVAASACTVNAEGERGSSGDGPKARSAGQALSVAPKDTFARAVCVCGDLTLAGTLTTKAPAGESADVGVTGAIQASTQASVDGALLADGALDFAGSVAVTSDLVARGLAGAGELTVGRDVSCGGGMATSGTVKIGGSLAVSGERTDTGSVEFGSEAAYVAPTGPACGCGAFDVVGAVAIAKASNDNAAHALPSTIEAIGDATITLDGGRYYFANATTVGRTKFVVKKPTAIYVDGSLDLVGANQFELADGATLDLYVAGNVAYAGTVVAGSAKDPSAFRLYVGGKDAIIAGAGEAVYRGFLFAPEARIAFAGTMEVEGALFAKGLDYAGQLTVTYVPATERADAPVSTDMPAPYRAPR